MLLPRREIHLWRIPQPDRSVPDWVWAHTSAAEQQRAATMQRNQRRLEWLSGRALLRRCLAQYCGLAPLALQFELTEEGKPLLRNIRLAPAFNLTLSNHWIACAVAHAAGLGLDLECEQRRNRIDAIAARYFHPAEQAALQACYSDAQRETLFFRFWTLKEAYIKARCGMIASMPLAALPFAADADAACFTLPSGEWHFHHQRFEEHEHLALASVWQDGDEPDAKPVTLVRQLPLA